MMNDVYSSVLWIRRFGHLGYDNVRRLVVSDHVKGMESVSSVVKPCIREVCVEGKAKILPFSASQSKAEAPLALLHIDLMGPFQYRTHDGFRYRVKRKGSWMSVLFKLTATKCSRCPVPIVAVATKWPEMKTLCPGVFIAGATKSRTIIYAVCPCES
jgi:hypothetical protein